MQTIDQMGRRGILCPTMGQRAQGNDVYNVKNNNPNGYEIYKKK